MVADITLINEGSNYVWHSRLSMPMACKPNAYVMIIFVLFICLDIYINVLIYVPDIKAYAPVHVVIASPLPALPRKFLFMFI